MKDMKKITLMLTLALSCFLAQNTFAGMERKTPIKELIENCLTSIDDAFSYVATNPTRSVGAAVDQVNRLIDRTYRQAQTVNYDNKVARKAYRKAVKKLEKTKKHLHKAGYKYNRKDAQKQIVEAKECLFDAADYLDRAEYYSTYPRTYRKYYDYD